MLRMASYDIITTPRLRRQAHRALAYGTLPPPDDKLAFTHEYEKRFVFLKARIGTCLMRMESHVDSKPIY